MTERKMASICRIDNLDPIEGADKIQKATIGGWQLVTAIDNDFKIGDLVVYIEVDAFVPTSLAPFLTKPGHTPKIYGGVEGEKLRSIRLRGQISQGLILPLSVVHEKMKEISGRPTGGFMSEGDDVTEILGIQKWEAPLSAQLAGMARGNFPSEVPKTDQERVQNLSKELPELVKDKWEVTEKMEGSSMSVILIDGDFHVCSRNLSLKPTEDNTFWQVVIRDNIEQKLRDTCNDNIAVQGELIGPGIQKNIYGLKDHKFMVFDVYDIKRGEYLLPSDRHNWCEVHGFKHVHVITVDADISNETLQSLISTADGKSVIGVKPNREGIVFKSMTNHHTSFKSISNAYLIKQGD